MKIDTTNSSERAITDVVPQGSVLGPIPFLVYVKDVAKLPAVQLAMFADDTAPSAVHRRADIASVGLQNQLDAYLDWADDWRARLWYFPDAESSLTDSASAEYPKGDGTTEGSERDHQDPFQNDLSPCCRF